MKTMRIVATLVTGVSMLVGGVVLTLAGPPAVMALGAATAIVGAFYTFAGLTLERALATDPAKTSELVVPEIDDDRLTPDVGVLAGSGSAHTA